MRLSRCTPQLSTSTFRLPPPPPENQEPAVQGLSHICRDRGKGWTHAGKSTPDRPAAWEGDRTRASATTRNGKTDVCLARAKRLSRADCPMQKAWIHGDTEPVRHSWGMEVRGTDRGHQRMAGAHCLYQDQRPLSCV